MCTVVKLMFTSWSIEGPWSISLTSPVHSTNQYIPSVTAIGGRTSISIVCDHSMGKMNRCWAGYGGDIIFNKQCTNITKTPTESDTSPTGFLWTGNATRMRTTIGWDGSDPICRYRGFVSSTSYYVTIKVTILRHSVQKHKHMHPLTMPARPN